MTPSERIEQLVPSLETCQKLKEVGFLQETYFYWHPFRDLKKWVLRFNTDYYNAIAAPTSSEIGEFLPEFIKMDQSISVYLRIELSPSTKEWRIQYQRKFDEGRHTSYRIPINPVMNFNEAEARAAMLIYLVERGVVTFRKENK